VLLAVFCGVERWEDSSPRSLRQLTSGECVKNLNSGVSQRRVHLVWPLCLTLSTASHTSLLPFVTNSHTKNIFSFCVERRDSAHSHPHTHFCRPQWKIVDMDRTSSPPLYTHLRDSEYHCCNYRHDSCDYGRVLISTCCTALAARNQRRATST
jgi:hypothetical protein